MPPQGVLRVIARRYFRFTFKTKEKLEGAQIRCLKVNFTVL
jgi:hypothetical protein